MVNNNPRVSIGLPVYNGEKYLKVAIDSILCQTFKDFELIISDNASTDQTEAICREYSERDSRIRYSRLPNNLGVTKNFNRVFEMSEADLFRWATADDFIAPQLVEKCIEVLDAEPETVLCYSNTTIIDENGAIVSKYDDNLDLRFPQARDRYRHFERNIGLCNVQYGLARSSVLRKTRLLGNFLRSDEVFLGELTLYGMFHEIPENLFFRRFHSEASSSINTTEELRRFYGLKSNKGHQLVLWRHLREKLIAVSRAPLGVREKAGICAMLLRDAFGDRRRMMGEVRLYLGLSGRTAHLYEAPEGSGSGTEKE
jgi:glycosyltransferase involved in cell wall biosynthesis